jgi:hypothetical protein
MKSADAPAEATGVQSPPQVDLQAALGIESRISGDGIQSVLQNEHERLGSVQFRQGGKTFREARREL